MNEIIKGCVLALTILIVGAIVYFVAIGSYDIACYTICCIFTPTILCGYEIHRLL